MDRLVSFKDLTNDQLIVRVRALVDDERRTTAQLLMALMELDSRGLHREMGFRSLFVFCTQHLHLSERAAQSRIEASRRAARFPVILDLIECGDVTLTAVGLIGRYLTYANHAALLAEIRHKTTRQVEEIVARLNPLPDAVGLIRKVPEPPQAENLPSAPLLSAETADDRADADPATVSVPAEAPVAGEPTQPSPPIPFARPDPGRVKPLSPGRYKLQVTLSVEARDNLMQARDLLRHAIPDGSLEKVIERALSLLTASLLAKRFGFVKKPRWNRRPADPFSRYIDRSEKRFIYNRDGGQCKFIGTEGRCTETSELEVHHVVPFALGGETRRDNLELRCRVHNNHEALKAFGRHLRRRRPASAGK